MALTAAGRTARQQTGIASWLYLALGTGTQAGNAEDQTALHTELVRVAIGASSVSGDVALHTALLTNAQGNGILTECGIYNQVSGGSLLSYQPISPPIEKTSDQGYILRVSETLTNA